MFEAKEVNYLGVIIGKGMVKMDSAKIKAVQKWPILKTKWQLQAFLGFCNFYHRFIKNFSQICLILYQLCGNTKWDWKKEHTHAFKVIKDKMTSVPVLVLPRDEGKWLVETDTSNFAFGGILAQEQPLGKYHLVAFLSKGMSPTERNWEIYDKELGAIKLAFDTWRQYLLGAKEPILAYSDHKNLTYWRKPQQLN